MIKRVELQASGLAAGGYVEESLVGLVRANRLVDRLFDPVLLKGLRVPLAYGFADVAMNAGRLLLIYSTRVSSPRL